MKTKQAIKLAGSAKALADLVGVTKSAVSQWGNEMPALREYILKDKRPEWFPAKAKS
jgi:predicted transcriptional regulator